MVGIMWDWAAAAAEWDRGLWYNDAVWAAWWPCWSDGSMAWCGPPGRIELAGWWWWRNLLEDSCSPLAPSLGNSPNGDMCCAMAIECGEIPALLLCCPVIEFMPKPGGWKKEFCAALL